MMTPYRRRLLARVFFGLTAGATLLGSFFTLANWHWQRAWEKYRAERPADSGPWFERTLDAAPAPVPDAENFALTPLLREIRETPSEDHAQTRVHRLYLEFGAEGLGLINWMRGHCWEARPVDLRGFQTLFRGGTNFAFRDKVANNKARGYRQALNQVKTRAITYLPTNTPPQSAARDLLQVLDRYRPELEEIEQALKLPHARYPLPYDRENIHAIALLHINPLNTFAIFFKLKAAALLAEGEVDQAFEYVERIHGLADALKDEPFWFSQLVRGRILDHAHGVVWEGLRRRQWSRAHGEQFIERLESLNLFEQFIRTQATERLGVEHLFMRMARDRPDDALYVSREKWTYLRWAPTGWFRANVLACARMLDETSSAAARRLSLIELLDADSVGAALKRRPHFRNLLARNFAPAIEDQCVRVWRQQVHVDLTRTACQLEFYHSAHGSYPEAIEELVPDYLTAVPVDLVNGQPLRYRRSVDGRFRLWSVGANGADDDGQLPPWEGNRKADDGDWVWRYEARREIQP